MSYAVIFQNGPDAPHSVRLEETFEEKPTKEQLQRIAANHGTVEGAEAWVEGEKAPKWAKPESALLPPSGDTTAYAAPEEAASSE